MRSGQVLQCFMNVSMSSSHDGLTKLAKQHGMDVRKLEPGEYVVFINGARDRIKVYASNNTIAYYRADKRGAIDLRVIQEIPRAFNGAQKLDYDVALKAAIEKSLENKRLKGLQVFSTRV